MSFGVSTLLLYDVFTYAGYSIHKENEKIYAVKATANTDTGATETNNVAFTQLTSPTLYQKLLTRLQMFLPRKKLSKYT